MKKSKSLFLKCVLSATVMGSALFVGYGEKTFASPVFSQWGEDGEEVGQFSFPQGMAIDQAGNLYVADTMNSRVQKFTSNGKFIQAWDIDGMIFGMPRAIAVDRSGLVYVNNGQGNIRVFQPDGIELRHWDDTNFLNAGVLGMAVDQEGNVYVSNAGLHQVRKYGPMGQTLLTWGAHGTAPGQFNAPSGIAIDRNGTIFIADPGNFRIQKFDAMGQYLGQWGEGESAEPGKFSFPQALTFDQYGNLHVMETKNYRIQVLDPYGKSIRMWGKEGSAPGEFEVTFGVAADNAGNIYVDDSMLRRVQKFSLTLDSPQIVTTADQATVTWPEVEGATDLELEWSQDGKIWSKKALTANETRTTIYPLTGNTHYQFRLSANFATGYRMASNLVEAVSLTADLTVTTSSPTGAGTDGKTKVSVKETAGEGNTFKYKNFKSAEVKAPSVGGSIGTDYAALLTDGLVAAASGDNIAVVEVDAGGKMVRFGQAKAMVAGGSSGEWGAPTNLTAIAGKNQVALKWDSVTGATYYNIYQKAETGLYDVLPTATVTGITYTVTGLTNGTTYYFAVQAGKADGVSANSNEVSATPKGDSSKPSNPSSGSSGSSGSPGPETSIGFKMIVDGKEYDQIATGVTTKENGKTVLTAKVDAAKLAAQLIQLGDKPVVIIPVASTSADKVSVVLTGDAVKALENKQAVLVVQTSNGNYKLPASQIAIDRLSAQLGEQVKLSDIVLQVDIAKSDDAQVKLIEKATEKGKFSVALPPINFTVNASYNGKKVDVDKFSAYVQREIPLPSGMNASKVTTATVLEADGTVYHVPTYLTARDGKYYAVVSSLTNSTYTLIWHPMTFADVESHWSKDAVNDMASRMIVNGTDETRYSPDKAITRAEFAAILVRSLGLSANGKTAAFGDVASGTWYTGAVAKALEYGIVNGYEDGTFRPSKTITRTEAMVMIERAMKLTGLEIGVSASEAESLLAPFEDASKVDAWARQAVGAMVKTGLVKGSETGLNPASDITRAETAAIVQRMLEKAKLIDNGNTK
ncbi:hypothetical protein GK047_27805 [Paenibacillus sp. SYP-B3998]|uniref:6-bladed beta-propeller n=1 Tax=Paenibacillus sp. SYP-B3998 TaxID=2678564 RepID=A0A6G4A5T3_9BACL|nr:S-layer homology domain-containing protein [Paenibacillus sp. SYP-B3998]NEW09732.1 hypothetical protein [Paenibacillus sp. SYP-B3998]